MAKAISSYPKVYAIGHRAIADIFKDEVIVEEKIDGSQFSFGLINGELHMRSKNAVVYADNPGMFAAAVATVQKLAADQFLYPDAVYRCEYLRVPKHNTLEYGRVPVGHLIGFDIETGDGGGLMSHRLKRQVFGNMGLETVPLLYEGKVSSLEQFTELLQTESVLGGVMIEGVVVKNQQRFGDDGKFLAGKFVSEAFKEKHDNDWKTRNPNRKDVVAGIIEAYATEARWQKAVQHMAEDGRLEHAPRDIGALIKMVGDDVYEEERDEIAALLFRHFWPDIRRGLTRGLPGWYKEQLAAAAFAETDVPNVLGDGNE
jgi:hypothetical protein